MESALTELLTDLEEAYSKSEIRKHCIDNGYEWFYSLVSSSLQPGGPLILGFNWGASKDEKYKPQKSISKTDFSKEDVGSLSRIFPYCKKYFGSEFISKITQSNYCFFRSKTEKQIKSIDIALCEPIFIRLIEIIEPSYVLCFSSKLRDFMLRNNKISSKQSKIIKYTRGKSIVIYETIKATLNTGIEICFLPHPNYPMKGEARSEAWEFCCGKG